MKLTQRQQEVENLILQGLSFIKIANKLFISTLTLKTHMNNIYIATGFSSRIELMANEIKLLRKKIQELEPK